MGRWGQVGGQVGGWVGRWVGVGSKGAGGVLARIAARPAPSSPGLQGTPSLARGERGKRAGGVQVRGRGVGGGGGAPLGLTRGKSWGGHSRRSSATSGTHPPACSCPAPARECVEVGSAPKGGSSVAAAAGEGRHRQLGPATCARNVPGSLTWRRLQIQCQSPKVALGDALGRAAAVLGAEGAAGRAPGGDGGARARV